MIRFEDVHKKYALGNTWITAIHDLSAEIARGDFVALAGPSGSGKTTLLNLAGCLDKPDHGRIWIDGEDVTMIRLSSLAGLRRSKLGFIFQSFNLIPVLTAFENIEYPLILRRMEKKQRHERVRGWLDRVGLAKSAAQRPDQLSGGQRQRVAIARAMAASPSVVIADEPTANLDSATANSILDLLQRINEQSAATFLVATHDPLVMQRATRTIHMRDGRITGGAETLAPMSERAVAC